MLLHQRLRFEDGDVGRVGEQRVLYCNLATVTDQTLYSIVLQLHKKSTPMKKALLLILLAVLSVNLVTAQSYRRETATLHKNASTYTSINSSLPKPYQPQERQLSSNNNYNTPRPIGSVKHYTNTDGVQVQSPTHYTAPPAGATAICRDGTYSFSKHRRGTCSCHGGVAKWLQ